MDFCAVKKENSKKELWIGFLLFFVSIIMNYLILIKNYHNWGGDFSQYISQAMALVNNNIEGWYENSKFIVNNSIEALSPSVYPWGYPIMLSLVYKVFGFNINYFKLVNVFLYSVYIFVFFLWLCKRIDTKNSVIISIFFIVNIKLLLYQNNILSDIPAMTFTMISVYIFDYYFANNGSLVPGLLLGISSFMCYFIRTQSIIVIASLGFVLCLYFIINCKSIDLNQIIRLCTPFFTFCILYIVTKAILIQDTSKYISLFGNFSLIKSANNCISYCEQIMNFFSREHILMHFSENGVMNRMICLLYDGFFIVLIISIIVGIHKVYRKDFYVITLLIFTIMMLLIYPYCDIRFMFGIFFIMVYLSYMGFSNLFRKTKIIYYLCTIFFIGVMIFNVLHIGNRIMSNMKNNSLFQSDNAESIYANELYNYVINSEEKGVYYFFKPRVLYLYTGELAYYKENEIGSARYVIDYLPSSSLLIEKAVINKKCIFRNEYFRIYDMNS